MVEVIHKIWRDSYYGSQKYQDRDLERSERSEPGIKPPEFKINYP